MERSHSPNALCSPTLLRRAVNAPLTSSAGRLFDAVAAVIGLCQRSSFEGEAAMEVEFAADRANFTVGPSAVVCEDRDVSFSTGAHSCR